MIDINWNLFKAKFNGREEEIFEKLSYMLFCSEHGNKVGIFRFKNQVGIETEPILVGGLVSGFQAKYYETKLADNKGDIIDSIKKAKDKNLDLQKLYFYTNREFSESRKKGVKKPAYLIEIEDAALKEGLSIEWRQPSHFEVQLSHPESKYLSEYFFGTDKSIVGFLGNITLHGEYILHSIQVDAKFIDKSIKIDRTAILEQLQKRNAQIILLSGDGGSGKTAIIKELFESEMTPIYIFKAAEFHQNSLASFFSEFGDYGFADFLSMHQEESQKTVVIDSAEKLADITNQDAFIEFLSGLLKNGWQVIFTTRSSYLDDLRFQMIEVYRLPFDVIQLPLLSSDQLQLLAERNKFTLPRDQRLLNLIRNPFYLNEYLQHYNEITNQTNIAKFRELLWNKKIQHSTIKVNNINILRERCFLSLAKMRCESGNFFINADEFDSAALAKLEDDEVIKYEPGQLGYFITHDIYEEWALEKHIENMYLQCQGLSKFFQEIGKSLPIRRAFRAWLAEKLIDVSNDFLRFVNKTFFANNIPTFWKDELLVSVLLSVRCVDLAGQ
jgi:hypothetical protein